MDTADAKFWVNLPPRLVCGPQKLLRSFGGKILCLHRHDCAIRGEEGIRLISAQSYWRFTLSKYWLSIFSLFVALTREPSKPGDRDVRHEKTCGIPLKGNSAGKTAKERVKAVTA